MPSNVVDSERDEKLWQKAKGLAEEAGHKEDWPYVMGVYKRMKPDHQFKESTLAVAARWGSPAASVAPPNHVPGPSPNKADAKKVAAVYVSQEKPDGGGRLVHLLAMLRAQHQNYWTSHWQVQGESFYGDHLLFERMYEAVVGEIDTLAEKLVVLLGSEAVNGPEQLELQTYYVTEWAKEPDPIRRGLHSEEVLQEQIKTTREMLDTTGALTLGMDDYLSATAGAHETNLYLLGQRINTWLKVAALAVKWQTLRGDHFSGTVREVDSNVLIVDGDDGQTHAVDGTDELIDAANADPTIASVKVAHDTEDFERLEGLFKAVEDPLLEASRILSPWQKFRGDKEAIRAKLALAAQAVVDNLEFHFERESQGKAFQKGVGRKVTNVRKLYKAWAGASTWDELEAVLRKQRTKSKEPWHKHIAARDLILGAIRYFDREIEDHLTVDKFKVVLISHPRADWDDEAVGKVQWILGSIGKLLDRKGFGMLAQGTVMATPGMSVQGSTLASYNVGTHVMHLAVGGDERAVRKTMIHELGHAYYFEYLPGQGRAGWEQFFGDNVGDPDVEGIIRAWEQFAASATDYEDKKYGRFTPYFYKHIKKTAPGMAMWVQLLVEQLDIKEPQSMYGFKRNAVPGLDQLIAKKGEAKVFLHPVTAYSGTSPEELYAETFAYLLTQGPGRIPPLVLDVFKRATPQARGASMRTAGRYTVYLFSDTGRELWKQDFNAPNERAADEAALRLVKPHLDRHPDAEDWVVEPVEPGGKKARKTAGAPEDFEEWWEYLDPGSQHSVLRQLGIQKRRGWDALEWEQLIDYYVRVHEGDSRGWSRGRNLAASGVLTETEPATTNGRHAGLFDDAFGDLGEAPPPNPEQATREALESRLGEIGSLHEAAPLFSGDVRNLIGDRLYSYGRSRAWFVYIDMPATGAVQRAKRAQKMARGPRTLQADQITLRGRRLFVGSNDGNLTEVPPLRKRAYGHPYGRHPSLDGHPKYDEDGGKRRERVPSDILNETLREGLDRLLEAARRLNNRYLFGFANMVKERKWEDAMHFYGKLDQVAMLAIPKVVHDEYGIKTLRMASR